MIRRTSKILLEIVGVAVAAAAVLLAVFAWRLSTGPVPVSLLNQTIVDAVNPSLNGGELSLEDTVIAWSAEDRRLSLRLVGVELKGAQGNVVARVPQLSFRLSVPALLVGTVAPTTIRLYGVEFAIIRDPSGITLGLSDNGREEQSAPDEYGQSAGLFAMLMASLSEDDPAIPFLSHLRRVGVRQGTLHFIDRVNDVEFVAPNANMYVARNGQALAGALRTDLRIGDTTAHLSLNGTLPPDAQMAKVAAQLDNLNPARLAQMSPAFDAYRIFDAPLALTGDLEIYRDGRIEGATLAIDAGEGRIDLPDPWNTELPLEMAHAELTLDGDKREIALKTLSLRAGPHAADATGTLVYNDIRGFSPSELGLDLKVTGFRTEVPGFFEGPVEASTMVLRGQLDLDALAAKVDRLAVDTGSGKVTMSGNLAMGETSPVLELNGTLDNLTLPELLDIWPLPVADGARKWVVENMQGGRVFGGRYDVNIPDGMLAQVEEGTPLPEDAVDFTFSMDGTDVSYIDGMPPIEDVAGRAKLTGDTFEAWVDGGTVRLDEARNVAFSNGHFIKHKLDNKKEPGVIDFTMAGKTSDLLGLLDHDPLNLIGKFGLDPAKVAGTGRVDGHISLPLVKEVTFDDVDFSGKAQAIDVAIPNIQPDISVTGGTLSIDVARQGMSATGKVSLNAVGPFDLQWKERFTAGKGPSSQYRLSGVLDDAGRKALDLSLGNVISGPMTIDASLSGDGKSVRDVSVAADVTKSTVRAPVLGWTKEPGRAATVSADITFLEDGGYRIADLDMKGDRIDLRGSLTLGAEGDLREADLPVVKLGPKNDFMLRTSKGTDAALRIDITGASIDSTGLLGAGGGEEEGLDAKPELPIREAAQDRARRIRVVARLLQVRGDGDLLLKVPAADLTFVDGRLYLADLSATDPEGKKITGSVKIAADGKRRMRLDALDAGALIGVLGISESITGGELMAEGVFTDDKISPSLAGRVAIDEFRVVDAPVLANLLTVGSLTGIRDTLAGEGIFFQRMEMPFALDGSSLEVDDARASGPAIGITASGTVELADNMLSLEGTIVPAYTINSILGEVPLLGPLIVGRKGEGIFGFTYRIRGASDNPDVLVNPLSVVAPGFLRRLFEFGSQMPDKEEKAETGRKDAPAPDAAEKPAGKSRAPGTP
ncbi:hypothetical protein FHS78_002934 [Parvibaculum indicum]|uniref:AsmA-like C-terminal domain-containing protein n=1 Tax=Parvibaculum indicum TaxID=562969 RepID=UPI001424A6BF|nr:AsmA-like C-terminal domain-containing protein [Parvibaculum indicum]NIJ42629.1 hypothetical protein [Parvibaculum indicum]